MELIGKPRKGQLQAWKVSGTENYGVEVKAYASKKEAERVASGLRSMRAWVSVEAIELSEVDYVTA